MKAKKEARDIVWVAGQSWDHYGGTHRSMAVALSEHCRILWVDPPSSPATQDRRSRRFGPNLTCVAQNVMRLSPAAMPGFTRRGIRSSTPLLVRIQVRWALRKLGFRPRAIVMLYLAGLLGGWGEDVVNVMYGTDDYVAGAELMRVSPRHLAHRERDALAKADVVVAVTPELAQRWMGMGVNPTVVPNGCQLLSEEELTGEVAQVALPRPIVGLIGRLSDRINFDVLEALADEGLSLLLIGPRDPRWEPGRFEELVGRDSVRYVGPVAGDEVPAYLRAMDLGITPYLDTHFNRASFPLKTLEYLSVGLPVVASSLPAMRWLRSDLESTEDSGLAEEILVLAEDKAGYISAVQKLLSRGDEARASRIRFARRHSWAVRALLFCSVIGFEHERKDREGRK